MAPIEIMPLRGRRLLVLGALAALSCAEEIVPDPAPPPPGRLSVSCCAGLPDSERSTDTVDFGAVQIGMDRTLELEVSNTGTGPLTITSIEPGGTFRADTHELAVVASPLVIGPDKTKTIAVSFRPLAVSDAPVTAFFRIVTGAAEDEDGETVMTKTVVVKGRGVSSLLLVEPNPVLFGSVLIGHSKTVPVRLTNEAGVAIDLTTRLGPDGRPLIASYRGAGRFELISPVHAGGSILPANMRLSPHTSTVVELRYTPRDGGGNEDVDEAAWTLSNCANALCALDVIVRGSPSRSPLRCEPAAIDFGVLNPGDALTETTTCTNIAGGELLVAGWELEEGSAGEYSIPSYSGSPSRLTEGSSFNLTATFTATIASLGRRPIGSVRIFGRSPGDPSESTLTRVTLGGDAGAPELNVSPAALDFGPVAVGTSVDRRLEIQNVGYAPLTVFNVDGDALGSGAFETDWMGSPMILEPGESAWLAVSFAPRAPGSVRSEVIVESDGGVVRAGLRGEAVDLPPCISEVTPAVLDFGLLSPLASSSRSLRIYNRGAADCLVTSVELAQGTPPSFSLTGPSAASVLIAPGASLRFDVGYSPAVEGVHTGTVSFYLSDPAAPRRGVSLRGSSEDYAISLFPSELDFGRIAAGCSASPRVVTIFNPTDYPTHISRVEWAPGSTSELSIDLLPPGGADLEPGGAIPLDVDYHPSGLGADSAVLHVWETGRNDPYAVVVHGEGAAGGTRREQFFQRATAAVDVLFIHDDYSTALLEDEMAQHLVDFFTLFQARGFDYHVAHTDRGACNEAPPNGRGCGAFSQGDLHHSATDWDPAWRVVTPGELPSPEHAFLAIVDDAAAGSYPLRSLQRALTPPLIDGWNSGFLRPEAHLAIIFVGRGPDHSPLPVGSYVNHMRALKGFGDPDQLSASMISPHAGDACSYAAPYSPIWGGPSPRLAQFVDQIGHGLSESICTPNFPELLADFSRAWFGFRRRFFLQNQPVPGSISVRVDGVLVEPINAAMEQQWIYDSANNTVSFEAAAIPGPGAEIVVEYSAQCL